MVCIRLNTFLFKVVRNRLHVFSKMRIENVYRISFCILSVDDDRTREGTVKQLSSKEMFLMNLKSQREMKTDYIYIQ